MMRTAFVGQSCAWVSNRKTIPSSNRMDRTR
jgi:hypothetical protein